MYGSGRFIYPILGSLLFPYRRRPFYRRRHPHYYPYYPYYKYPYNPYYGNRGYYYSYGRRY